MLPKTMRAMIVDPAEGKLLLQTIPLPQPGPGEVLLRVAACGVCRTDLHILDQELPHPKGNLIPGHEIVGSIVARGPGADLYPLGARVGVPWLGWTCGECRYCRNGRENLCDRAEFTGYTRNGGYAEYAVADQRYCFPLPENLDAAETAPLLCAGLIGYRTYRMAGEGIERLGLYGFGAAAHLVAQIAVHQGKKIFAFTRPGDLSGQSFARRLGAVWAGDATELPPEPLDAALIFAPVGSLVPAALKATGKGGRVVCGGIHMSDIPAFPYRLLWEERQLLSVANLTRQDGIELLALAETIPLRPEVRNYPLEKAMEAIAALRNGRIEGAAVLLPQGAD